MNNQPKVNLLFAFQNGELRTVRDFQNLRGAKMRPTDLTCPECNHGVTVKLSPTMQIADHFAHLPDAACRLRDGGESAAHLNAKAGLSLWLSRFRKFALSFKCVACQNWDTCLRIEGYDQVIPELTIGRRRPDISILNAGEVIGAAEIKHSHSVDSLKKYDLAEMGINWFEIPTAGAHKKFYNIHALGEDWLTIDARAAGITYPVIPDYCSVCAEYRRREEKKLAEQSAFRNDWERAKIALPFPERMTFDRKAMETAVARLREADAVKREQTAAEKAEREQWEQRQGDAYLTENGELIIPCYAKNQWKWWKPCGQSVWQTLIELNAPLKTWALYAYHDAELLTDAHAARCSGAVTHAPGFAACAECGRYW